MNYKIISLKERYDLFEKQDEICEEVWPEFMLHDPIADQYWMQFTKAFKEYQLLITDGDEILAVMNTVPLHYEGTVEDLPQEGWDWGVKKSVEDHKKGLKPNILLGLQIVVNKRYQGQGLSGLAVKEMAALRDKMGFHKLIIPVRPSDKHKYPLIEMEDYIFWEKSESLPRDNWLRVHKKAGGKIIKVCNKAMYIPGTIEQWGKWTGLDFPGSGSYIVPGALNPVTVDVEKDSVVYVEPNVWVLHEAK